MIKKIIYKGGGTNGQGYVGAFTALHELGHLDFVDGVAGTSAGSLFAFLHAIGYSAIEIKILMDKTNFSKFEDGFNPMRFFISYGIYKGETLLEWVKQRLEDKGFGKMATFADLHAREMIDLNVFASNISTHTVQRLSFAETPNTPIAEAVVSSMAIPGIYKAWQFTCGELVGMWFVDGGMVDNFPIENFDDTCDPSETLGLFLYDVNGLHVPQKFGLYSPMKYIRNVFSTLMAAQDIQFMCSKTNKGRSVIIDTLGHSAIDFSNDQKMKDALTNSGYNAVKSRFLQVTK